MIGIGLTVVAYFFFSIHDASIKWLVAGLPVMQILFCRSIFIVTVAVARGGRPLLNRAMVTPLRRALIVRGAVILVAWLCYYTAARSLTLAKLTTIYFAAPIGVTLLAIPMLGERVTKARWVGVILGFVGVVIACNASVTGVSLPELLALIAAGLWAYALILLRQVARSEGTLLQILYTNGAFLVGTGVTMPFLWQTPGPFEALILGCVGLLGTIGQFSLFEAIRHAQASVLATFEYTALIWAFILGFLIWGDIPRPEVFVGAAAILLSGLFVALVEWARAPRD
jgi:drug/metabolite transporter (DMT)-like permease